MSGRVKARDTVARETPAASATWLIVGASRRLDRLSIHIPVRAPATRLRRPVGFRALVRLPVVLTRNRLQRIVPFKGATSNHPGRIAIRSREESFKWT